MFRQNPNRKFYLDPPSYPLMYPKSQVLRNIRPLLYTGNHRYLSEYVGWRKVYREKLGGLGVEGLGLKGIELRNEGLRSFRVYLESPL